MDRYELVIRNATVIDGTRAPRYQADIGVLGGKIAAIGRLDAGAVGVSTGLYYEPACEAPTEEVIEVCRPLARRNGLYVTHMRNEGENILASLEETFRIGREVGVPVVISHHKVAGQPNHGRSTETLQLIEARMKSQPIGLDCYPYCASSTILSASRAAVASKTLVTWSKPHPEVAGMSLD